MNQLLLRLVKGCGGLDPGRARKRIQQDGKVRGFLDTGEGLSRMREVLASILCHKEVMTRMNSMTKLYDTKPCACCAAT